ncbi:MULTISPECIES: type II toxin-antitoxin system Phd/YefM family antitoxin [Peptostreptococcaceae]|uniref:type II toxin-antitoxin system Phd/YefM family antitoxin n=1 Tax=Peptostreptococcaceae TaxID=186804 RepID=UPI0022E2B5CF|nr:MULTISPECIES: type II toxin-antitoxin system Phd/YefM family antitoxin [Clostridia]
MELLMGKKDIVSSSEISKNFSKYRKQAKEHSKIFVFKNNKPDLVMLDYDQFESIMNKLNQLEDDLIYEKLKNRPFHEGDKTYSLKETKNMIAKIKSNRSKK